MEENINPKLIGKTVWFKPSYRKPAFGVVKSVQVIDGIERAYVCSEKSRDAREFGPQWVPIDELVIGSEQ